MAVLKNSSDGVLLIVFGSNKAALKKVFAKKNGDRVPFKKWVAGECLEIFKLKSKSTMHDTFK